MDLQVIQSKIYNIRGYKVMLDFDLAELYQIKKEGVSHHTPSPL